MSVHACLPSKPDGTPGEPLKVGKWHGGKTEAPFHMRHRHNLNWTSWAHGLRRTVRAQDEEPRPNLGTP